MGFAETNRQCWVHFSPVSATDIEILNSCHLEDLELITKHQRVAKLLRGRTSRMAACVPLCAPVCPV